MICFYRLLSAYCRLPLRGGHRLVAMFGDGNDKPRIIGNVTLPLDHSDLGQRYIYYGLYEQDFVAHLRRVLRPGDVFIDPGANIGYISAVAADVVGPTGRVLALEPSRICLERIRTYLPQPNIDLLPMALSDACGSATFYDTPRVIARGFSCLAAYEEPEDGVAYEVETVTVDDLCAREGLDRVRYLKLDVEGSELAAIKGARRMLASRAIDYVMVETNFTDPSAIEIRDTMRSHGYSPFMADWRGRLRPVDFGKTAERGDVVWSAL
ncbi:MAG TPA: FkbM family methyltransferase [Caulobacteraceae bacterium]